MPTPIGEPRPSPRRSKPARPVSCPSAWRAAGAETVRRIELAEVRVQHVERRVGQRDVAVASTLAVDVEEQALAIDLRRSEPRSLEQPQPAGVDGGQAGAVDDDAHASEEGLAPWPEVRS